MASAALPSLALLTAALVPVPREDVGSLLGLPCLCPFRRVTGLPCPGCGITRSLVCCAHGQWEAALRFHPLGPLLFALLAAVALRAALRRAPLSERRQSVAAAALAALLLLVWALRLAGWLPLPPG